MYLNYKDKKIQYQKKIISQLQEENECLKDQLEQYNPEHIAIQLKLMNEAYDEYQALTKDLYTLKSEYEKLIRDAKIDQNQFLRASKSSK